MMANLFFWIVVILGIDSIQGNPNTVPRSSCVNMQAGHSVNNLPQQPQPCPYEIVPSKKDMPTNSAIQVQVRVKSTFPIYTFRGFQLMAFDVKNPSEPIGTFSIPVNGQVMTQCPNRPMIGLSHSENSDKTVGGGTWTPPLNYTGNVVFKATFVRTLLVYWVQETSEVVTVGSLPPPTEATTSSTSSTTTSITTTVLTSTTMSSTSTTITKELETSTETTPITSTNTSPELVETTPSFTMKTTDDELTSKIMSSAKTDDEISSGITNTDVTLEEASAPPSTETSITNTELPVDKTKEPSSETTLSNETGNTDESSKEPNLTTNDISSLRTEDSSISLEPIIYSTSESGTSIESSTSTLKPELISSLGSSQSMEHTATNISPSITDGIDTSLPSTSNDQTIARSSSSSVSLTTTVSSSSITTSIMSTITRLSSTTTTPVEPDFTIPNKGSSLQKTSDCLIGGILVTILLAAASTNLITF